MSLGRGRGERASVAVLLVAWLGIAVLLLLAIGRVGAVAAIQARAEAAADASALAAADALARGASPRAAAGVANRIARANGARLRACSCAGSIVSVEVAVEPGGTLAALGPLRARAHAEITWTVPDAGSTSVRRPDRPR